MEGPLSNWQGKWQGKRKWGVAVLMAVIVAAGAYGHVKAVGEGSANQSDDISTELSKEDEASLKKIKAAYNVDNQKAIAEELEQKKQEDEYTADHMLVEYNPFGTNTLSLYFYFKTDDAVKVSYTVSTLEKPVGDFTQDVSDTQEYTTEHEFQLIGLVPDAHNEITITLTSENGDVSTKNYQYDMGSILGDEELQLNSTIDEEKKEALSDGLYVVLGNDDSSLDFMYYYDNAGVLRGEVPILGYRSHRLIWGDDQMYYSISETKMAAVNRLGQVTNVYDTGDYELHHDYVFDDNGNILILATDTTQDSVEDIIIRLDADSGEVQEVLDLGDLLGDYKNTCVKNSDDELDWMHINAIQWMGKDSVLLSSRETSTIIKVTDIYDNPQIEYMLGDDSFWADTKYEELLYQKKGDFTIQGGQHSITYVKDDSLEEGQYYLYMFNNNNGVSETQPDFDWTSAGLSNGADNSYYYKYLVDENAGTFQLADSFKVPYSGYVSSVQELDGNVIVDSGVKGVFQEYDENHDMIAEFKMSAESFIYRVYKYQF